jgi:hypothetical protein
LQDSQTEGVVTDAEYGYALAILLFLAIAMQVALNTNGMKIAMSLGYNIRSIFMISVYLKSLDLSARSGGRDSQEKRFADAAGGEEEGEAAEKEGKEGGEEGDKARRLPRLSRKERKALAAAAKAAVKSQKENDADISSAGRMLQVRAVLWM